MDLFSWVGPSAVALFLRWNRDVTVISTLVRIGNVLMLGLFLYAGAVQYNDPDSGLWMVAYGAGALCCALFLIKRLPVLLSAVVSGFCLIGALYLLAQIVIGPQTFVDETGRQMMGLMEAARELLGLLITGIWSGVLAVRTGAQRQESSVGDGS